MKVIPIKIKKLHQQASLPERKTREAAAYDVSACCPEREIALPYGKVVLVPTGIALEIPINYEAQIRPRSGFSTRNAILLPNSPGTIDSDYRGEVFIPLLNLGSEEFFVSHGMRIAQLLVRECFGISWEEVDVLADTERGKLGFGSTGTH